MTEPLACCLNALSKMNMRRSGEVVVIGDGFMGLLNMQLAKLSGRKVIVIGHHNERLKVAERLGAHRVINSRKIDPVEEVRREFPEGADAVIVSVGNKEAIETGLRLVGIGGAVNIFAGAYPPVKINLDSNLIHYGEIVLTGTNVAPPERFREAVETLASRQIDIQTLITKKFSLDDIKSAFEAVENRKVIKAVIIP